MKKKITIEVDIEPMSEMAARDAGINGASECFNSISRLGECWTYPDGAKIWKPTESLSEAAKRYWRNNCELNYKSFMDSCWNALIFPTVSYIKENKDIIYKPTFDANGHDFVEIAGIKWATMNVGANNVTDYGLYFQWGYTQGYTADQVGKKKFDVNHYKWYDTYKDEYTKYKPFDKTALDLEDDAVHAAWKGSWRMPTKDEFAKLRDAVDTVWTDNYNNSGVAGLLCTDKNDKTKTLFFPACGFAYDGAVIDAGVNGNYWSSSLNSNYVSDAYSLDFLNGFVDWQRSSSLYFGFAVRGVLAEN